MAKVYVEARPKGRPDGTYIQDYVVEDQEDKVLIILDSEQSAIRWAKNQGHIPLVTRARHLNDKRMPYHWHAA